MSDVPGVLLVATIWAYWFGVGLMIVRAWHQSHQLAGLIPRQPLERAMWIIWLPLVSAWVALPYLALVRSHGFAVERVFARDDGGYSTLRWVAAICAVACLLLTSVCWSRMGRNWRMDVPTKGEEELITDGPFRYVRHPIYALSMLLMICSAFVVPTVPMFVIAIVHIVLLQLKARNEEQHLLAVHAVAYRRYLERSGRFLPKLG